MGKRYSDKLIKKIRKVRESEKLSYKELQRRFNIPDSTIGGWCEGTVGTKLDTLLINNERRRVEIKYSESYVVPQNKAINKKKAMLFAGLLYGCEGSKYPAQRGVAFANSDPELITAFLQLLRKGFELDESKFSVHLQIHTTHNFEDLRKYWSRLLNLPEKCFSKPTVTVPRGGKHRIVYMGTCTLRYWDYKIQLKLLGIFEKFVKSFVSK